MPMLNPNDPQALRNLASALRQVMKETDCGPKPPPVTDQDILRAMLGKPWGPRGVAAPGQIADQPARKAG